MYSQQSSGGVTVVNNKGDIKVTGDVKSVMVNGKYLIGIPDRKVKFLHDFILIATGAFTTAALVPLISYFG